MDSLIKQTRSRFDTRPRDKTEESTRERKIPPQQTQSYRERKRSQSWIRRQFSRQMSSSDYDLNAADYPMAVAAAAYAVQSLEDSKTRERKERKTLQANRHSFNKSQEQDIVSPHPEPLKSALKSSDQTSKKSFKDTADIKVPISNQKKPSHRKKLSFVDADETFTTQQEEPPAIDVAPLGRPSTFADKHLNITEDKKYYRPPTPLPRGQVQPVERIRPSVITRPVPADSQADAWEKEEMASIKERYEKMKDTIDNWENKKKAKAKRKIERIEADLEKKRIKADSSSDIYDWERKKAELDKKRIRSAHSHRIEVKRIEGIAGGARTQAEENRKKEEYRVREKANKIRATGELPPTCFCF